MLADTDVCQLEDVEPLSSLTEIVKRNPEITSAQVAELVLSSLQFATRWVGFDVLTKADAQQPT